jgi:DNA-binding IclR family transcriptional regulator
MENDVRDSRTTGGVQAVDHALALLLAFQDGAALLGPTELSQRLKLSKSAVHAILVSLERQGFVYRDVGAGKYGLGPRLAQLGRLWQEDLATRSLARPALEWLARESGETVFLGVVQGGRAIYADRIESQQRLRVVGEIGTAIPLHATALGKVLLAHFPAGQLRAALDGPLEAYTPHTITAPEQLREECAAIRAQGFAVSWGERDEMTLGIAAPVRNPAGEVHAALTVAGPRGRLDVERATELVVRAAGEVTARLGLPVPGDP